MTQKPHESTKTPFKRIRTERISEKVANQLKQVIGDGLYRVGDRLPAERELAEQMGVSRPSVREAIQMLELRGMLETVHGGGSIVKNLAEQEFQRPIEAFIEDDRRRVLELTEVRAFMEAWAARQAAKHRTDEQLDAIRGFLEEMEADYEKGRIRSETDFKFHTEIAAATRNMIFVHLIDSIYQLVNYSIKIHREKVFVTREDQAKILEHHKRIFQAIEASDPETAEAAMNEHLNFVVSEFRSRF